ncbi:hypothetical protein CFP65_6526 [Kitasatospora sp. MMS16-BH015]|uniref:hypothetical protein n=1 Tax=Kitasatospora sp. MMS16-BH015 TaxID=2018025 RepID=UPI000CA274B5|nr:hypothetical protein [Kitasatospora sp. MMS16-BH015]AUG81177.1 hypothetical protein CFP65_6526 [Kitasatospora sp. MMS16-BH015]
MTALRPLLTLAAAACALAACTGPGTDQASPEAPAAAASVSPSASEPPVDPADPATWRLPLEAYRLSPAEEAKLAKAATVLTQRCVREGGLADWEAPAPLPKLGGKTYTDWRYGIHDAALAERRGYHPDADEQAAYDAALADTMRTQPATVDSCAIKSRAQLGAGEHGKLADTLAGEAWGQAKREPAVVEAFGRWSACMAEQGYHYREPMDANAGWDSSGVSTAERKTAVADIACRVRTQVAKIWFDAEARLQLPAEQRESAALKADRAALDDALRTAEAVLADSD